MYELPFCSLVWFCPGAHAQHLYHDAEQKLKPIKLLGHVRFVFPNNSVSWISISGFGSVASLDWVAKLAWLQSMSKGVERFGLFDFCPCFLSLMWGQCSVLAQCEVHFRALASGWAVPLSMIVSCTFLCHLLTWQEIYDQTSKRREQQSIDNNMIGGIQAQLT